MLTDDELMTKFNAGDQETFTTLVNRYKQYIFDYMLIRTHDRELASDLAQDVFIKLYQSVFRYQARGKFKSWLSRIAHNIYIDAVRKRPNARILPLDPELSTLIDENASPAMSYESKEIHALTDEALSALPEAQRTAFELCQYHGMRYQEIALIMNCPVGTIKSRVHAALSKIREVFIENDML